MKDYKIYQLLIVISVVVMAGMMGILATNINVKPYEIYMVCSYDYDCAFKYDRQAPINLHVKFTDDIRKSSKMMPYPEQAHFAVVGDPTYLKWIDIPLDKKPYLVSDMKI